MMYDSFSTKFFREYSMDILIKSFRRLLVVTAVSFGVCAMIGSVYAQ